MPKVFLSYRRSDTRPHVGRIVDRLETAGYHVFYDVDTIKAGVQWREAIRSAVSQAEILVAVIGSQWLSDRLNEPDDPVMMEISLALDLDKPVMPLLLDRSPMPTDTDLPESLRKMRSWNAAYLSTTDPSFGDDMDRLIRSLDRISGRAPGVRSVPSPSEGLFTIPRSILQFGITLGWQLGRFEIIRDSAIPEVVAARKEAEATILEALKSEGVPTPSVDGSFSKWLQGILTFYSQTSLDKQTAILLGISAFRLSLVRASGTPQNRQEMKDLAFSAIAQIDPVHITKALKVSLFDSLVSSHPSTVVDVLEAIHSHNVQDTRRG